MRILVTGGAGYIGSHTALRLLERGHDVTVIDDLSRGNRAAVDILRDAAPHPDAFEFSKLDVGATDRVAEVMRSRRIEAVIHFAALAYVGESVDDPLRYYRVNSGATIGLLEAMRGAEVGSIVFSSTCATYGEPEPSDLPITESCPQRPVNPYGRSKLFVEQVLADRLDAATRAGEPFSYAALRYFNVAGCDLAARLGEDHRPETHLIPICLEVALGQRRSIRIFGTDYSTPDGTCVRDYVHVDDLAEAHLAALEALRPGQSRRCNVGIGRGHSVREVIESCRRVTGAEIPVEEGPRRPGDPPALWADASRIGAELGWRPKVVELDEIVASAWRWRSAHPNGYA